MEKVSGYLYNDVLKSRETFVKSMDVFLSQTCRMNGMSVGFDGTPFLLVERGVTIVGLKWNMEGREMLCIGYSYYKGAMRSETEFNVSELSVEEKYKLCEHIVKCLDRLDFFVY